MTEGSRWSRVRDHKVIQWLFGYAAAAFALLQCIEIVADAFDWSGAFVRVATVLLALGLPLTAVLAWYHGHRGEQSMGRMEIGLLGSLVVVAIPLAWLAAASPDGASARQPAEAEFSPPERSVAVMPFLNLSSKADDEYFSDGLSEELLAVLAKVTELQVAGRTSSFSFKGKAADIPTVGRALNVAAVLEGSVRRTEDRVRVTAQLVSTVTGFSLWTETLDRAATDVLSLQTDIATRVAYALKVQLVEERKNRFEIGGTKDSRALDAFFKARRAAADSSAAGTEAAIAGFDTAITLDPRFASAYALRGTTRVMLATQVADAGQREKGFQKALEDARRAVELAPDSGHIHAALSYVLMYSGGDPQAMVGELSMARKLEPGNAQIQALYASTAGVLGWADAVDAGNRAVALDPLNPDAHNGRASALYYQRRYAEGLISAEAAMRLQDHVYYRTTAFHLLYALGRYDDALELTKNDEEADVIVRGVRAMAKGKLGQRPEAERQLQALHAEMGASAAPVLAEAYAQWAEPREAIKWLNEALTADPLSMLDIHVHPLLDPLREMPEFKALAARVPVLKPQ